MGLVVAHPEFTIALTPLSLAVITIFLFMIIKDREPFLKQIMIIARTERLLHLHDQFSEFPDGSLLPEEFIRISRLTYEDYIKEQKWKKRSLFFTLVLYHLLLIGIVITVSIAVNWSTIMVWIAKTPVY